MNFIYDKPFKTHILSHGFKCNITEFVQRLKPTKPPVVLTVNGKAELVVQDAESYQKLLDAFELLETLKGIKLGSEQR